MHTHGKVEARDLPIGASMTPAELIAATDRQSGSPDSGASAALLELADLGLIQFQEDWEITWVGSR